MNGILGMQESVGQRVIWYHAVQFLPHKYSTVLYSIIFLVGRST